MAVRTIEQVTDDIDGSADAEHVTFSFDGTEYVIDLSPENKAKLADALSLYIGHATKTTGGSSRRAAGVPSAGAASDAKAIRAWAGENDVAVPARGRIPGAVVEQWKASLA
ncbi:Lsr2 family protein [Quadrisphaera sp. INWT6]|uniref:histone-like nucleoid-structuring protein Lsr2 n=1 Tax=Quadrisphaera sp. INWT6 TaxID=2596917 RepID=UPI001891FC62|nr:Lsr2 family protein [Quadrisphaera sp. INWT6]MBF5082644.1 Lsr2 family protein [Quadrisphaera sp. INWT6]